MDLWHVINYWFCDPGSTSKPQHSGHMQPRRSTPGLHNGVTPAAGHGIRAWLKAASSGEILCWFMNPFAAASRSAPLLKVASKDDSARLHAQVADEQKRDANRPPLSALVVDVNIRDREVGARRVGRTAELAGNHHALNGPRRAPERARDLNRRAREVARESIRVEEHDAMVLGDHVGRSPPGNCQ